MTPERLKELRAWIKRSKTATSFGVERGESYARMEGGRRPLPEAAIAYGLDDVRYLLTAWQSLEAQLTELETNRPVIAYWIPDPENDGGKFANKVDQPDAIDEETGKLTLIGRGPKELKWCRSLSIEPSGKILVATSMMSDDGDPKDPWDDRMIGAFSSFTINEETGQIALADQSPSDFRTAFLRFTPDYSKLEDAQPKNVTPPPSRPRPRTTVANSSPPLRANSRPFHRPALCPTAPIW